MHRIETLGIIVRGDQILLGEKLGNPAIGKGLLNGPGGKLEEGETILECLSREVREETGLIIRESCIVPVAVLECYVQWVRNRQVHVFLITDFRGTPKKTSSMDPQWFLREHIPFDRMHEADEKWLLGILNNKRLRVYLNFEEPGKGLLNHRLVSL